MAGTSPAMTNRPATRLARLGGVVGAGACPRPAWPEQVGALVAAGDREPERDNGGDAPAPAHAGIPMRLVAFFGHAALRRQTKHSSQALCVSRATCRRPSITRIGRIGQRDRETPRSRPGCARMAAHFRLIYFA